MFKPAPLIQRTFDQLDLPSKLATFGMTPRKQSVKRREFMTLIGGAASALATGGAGASANEVIE
jgi:hypothetical protein